jgi:hypothetical protein
MAQMLRVYTRVQRDIDRPRIGNKLALYCGQCDDKVSS